MSDQQDCHQRTLGQHLGTRLSQIGCRQFFAVPGDYNLALLDELLKESDLQPHWCCNELNAGYAADGAARVAGIGCLVVTFTVGGLSAINAVAGAYAENLPVICITGGPNSNDYARNAIIHHTIGDDGGFSQELECFKQVTCEQVVIRSLNTAHELIDRAISAALHHSKPAYICIATNLATLPHPSFARPPTPYALTPLQSNQKSLNAAVTAAANFLNSKQKPVLVAGPLLRTAKAIDAFMHLVETSGYAFAFQPAAKGLLPEDHPACMGTYWGQVSTPVCGEVVESADGYVFAGPIFNDYATVGDTLAVADAKMVTAAPYRVTVAGGAGGQVYGCVNLKDFLDGLASVVEHNSTSLDIWERMKEPECEIPPTPANSPLMTKVLYKHIQQRLLNSGSILVAETGDAVFNCQKMKLPKGCQYYWSQQYGSIGWSVGAVLGLAAATKENSEMTAKKKVVYSESSSMVTTAEPSSMLNGQQSNRKRVVACIGDGSFQMTCQEISTMLRYKLNPVIILINNGSYTIEVQIHDGPYNVLKSWDYVKLVESMDADQGNIIATKVTTEEELVAALEVVQGEGAEKLCFIEAVVHKDDCTKELLEWGRLVSKSNSRPPQKW